MECLFFYSTQRARHIWRLHYKYLYKLRIIFKNELHTNRAQDERIVWIPNCIVILSLSVRSDSSHFQLFNYHQSDYFLFFFVLHFIIKHAPRLINITESPQLIRFFFITGYKLTWVIWVVMFTTHTKSNNNKLFSLWFRLEADHRATIRSAVTKRLWWEQPKHAKDKCKLNGTFPISHRPHS